MTFFTLSTAKKLKKLQTLNFKILEILKLKKYVGNFFGIQSFLITFAENSNNWGNSFLFRIAFNPLYS